MPTVAWTIFALMSFLFVAWTALWMLDYGYYQRLLGGAVRTLLDFEKTLPSYAARVSTRIEENFRTAYHGHFWFYALIHGALGMLAMFALYDAAGWGGWLALGMTVIAGWTTAVLCNVWPSSASRAKAALARTEFVANKIVEVAEARSAAIRKKAEAKAVARTTKAKAKADAAQTARLALDEVRAQRERAKELKRDDRA